MQTNIPFFEQIAFDFYRTEILVKNPVKKKISVYEEIQPFQLTEIPFWYPRCIDQFEIKEHDNFKSNLSKKKVLNLENLDHSKFKIKEYGKGSFPKLFVSQSLLFNENRNLVVIQEIYKWSATYYYIELDNHGKIIDWCSGGYIE
ncbi:hypothetical protein GCM10022260_04330 [Gaetbulibacter aestuarii]